MSRKRNPCVFSMMDEVRPFRSPKQVAEWNRLAIKILLTPVRTLTKNKRITK